MVRILRLRFAGLLTALVLSSHPLDLKAVASDNGGSFELFMILGLLVPATGVAGIERSETAGPAHVKVVEAEEDERCREKEGVKVSREIGMQNGYLHASATFSQETSCHGTRIPRPGLGPGRDEKEIGGGCRRVGEDLAAGAAAVALPQVGLWNPRNDRFQTRLWRPGTAVGDSDSDEDIVRESSAMEIGKGSPAMVDKETQIELC
ncbi:hypothetical protein HDU96_002417 [Phlyctochytrium bullatum]|nr:hypothetical protein HDU96_002417 [Phlyctochytrium bullatum]